jgi:hypothetical protein
VTRLGLVAVIVVGVVGAAQAAPQCYRPNEIEADQAVRYQAKLMVLSDSCRSNSYNQFVHHNAKALSLYQEQLIGFFRRHDAHHPEDAFDKFLTRVANQIALAAGEEPLTSLCPKAADLFTQAVAFDKDDFSHYVAAQAAVERKSYPTCTE